MNCNHNEPHRKPHRQPHRKPDQQPNWRPPVSRTEFRFPVLPFGRERPEFERCASEATAKVYDLFHHLYGVPAALHADLDNDQEALRDEWQDQTRSVREAEKVTKAKATVGYGYELRVQLVR